MRIVLCLLLHVCISECFVLAPCELARNLFLLLNTNLRKQYLSELPLLVCIAGFQNFNTSYAVCDKTHQEVCTDNIYYGIFGIELRDIMASENKYDSDNISYNLDIFLETVLNADKKYHPNYQFYTEICSHPYVKPVYCNLNPYVAGGYEVYEPMDRSLLTERRKSRGLADDQPILLKRFINKKEIVATHSFISWQMILSCFAFWIIGSGIYIISSFTYDFLRYKYLRHIGDF